MQSIPEVRPKGATKARTKADEYLPVLTQATADKRFTAKASGLLQQWTRIRQVAAATDTASVHDLRQAVCDLKNLSDQSCQTKYRFLIERLFDD